MIFVPYKPQQRQDFIPQNDTNSTGFPLRSLWESVSGQCVSSTCMPVKLLQSIICSAAKKSINFFKYTYIGEIYLLNHCSIHISLSAETICVVVQLCRITKLMHSKVYGKFSVEFYRNCINKMKLQFYDHLSTMKSFIVTLCKLMI